MQDWAFGYDRFKQNKQVCLLAAFPGEMMHFYRTDHIYSQLHFSVTRGTCLLDSWVRENLLEFLALFSVSLLLTGDLDSLWFYYFQDFGLHLTAIVAQWFLHLEFKISVILGYLDS